MRAFPIYLASIFKDREFRAIDGGTEFKDMLFVADLFPIQIKRHLRLFECVQGKELENPDIMTRCRNLNEASIEWMNGID